MKRNATGEPVWAGWEKMKRKNKSAKPCFEPEQGFVEGAKVKEGSAS